MEESLVIPGLESVLSEGHTQNREPSDGISLGSQDTVVTKNKSKKKGTKKKETKKSVTHSEDKFLEDKRPEVLEPDIDFIEQEVKNPMDYLSEMSSGSDSEDESEESDSEDESEESDSEDESEELDSEDELETDVSDEYGSDDDSEDSFEYASMDFNLGDSSGGDCDEYDDSHDFPDRDTSICYPDVVDDIANEDLGGENVSTASVMAASMMSGAIVAKSKGSMAWYVILFNVIAVGGLGLALYYAWRRIQELSKMVKTLEEENHMAINERDVQVITTKVIEEIINESGDEEGDVNDDIGDSIEEKKLDTIKEEDLEELEPQDKAQQPMIKTPMEVLQSNVEVAPVDEPQSRTTV